MNSNGNSLVEVLVATTVGILVVSALTYATIFSIRNASFAKNSVQATKLAQEGIEKVRTLRDRNGIVYYNEGNLSATNFSELWQFVFICPDNCYFRFKGVFTNVNVTDFETIQPNFKRQFWIEDAGTEQKKITSFVQWTDFSGTHESKLTTILRKL